MTGRKKIRMEDATTSYSGFFQGLDQEQDVTPRKRKWEDHVVFSDDEEDAMDPFGYARNSVQRVVTSTPLRAEDGESGESLTALHFFPERQMAKASRKSVTGSNPLSSTAKEWGQSLSSWNLSSISSSSGHSPPHQPSILQTVSGISSQMSRHDSERDVTLLQPKVGESSAAFRRGKAETQMTSSRRPLHSTGLPNCPSFEDWDVSAISTRSSRHIATNPGETSSQNVPHPSLFFTPSSRSASKKFQCQICARPFAQKGHASAHPTTHMDKSELVKERVAHVECQECHKIFFNNGAYTMHMKSHQSKEQLKCEDCGKEFRWQSDLSRHLFTHLTPEEKALTKQKWKSVCYFCDKRFLRPSILERHFLIHSTEKAYNCNQCKRSFSRNGDLTVHNRSHADERPFPCEECGKRFSTSSSLTRHQQDVHRMLKNFKCPQCDKAFSQKSTMVNHLNAIHLKVKQDCKKCGKSFSLVGYLRRHDKTTH